MEILKQYTLERVPIIKDGVEVQNLGSIYDPLRDLVCKTMELPWLNNQNNISCIPEGTYLVVKQAPSMGRDYTYFRFADVPGRTINQVMFMSSILMHPITKVEDLAGCVGVGSRFADIDGDGDLDMVESKKKLLWMAQYMPAAFYLKIIKKP